MAVGDKADILNRLLTYVPDDWFGDSPPLLTSIFSGYAELGKFIYDGYLYTKLQTRIETATDENLDLISKDFFGDGLPRRPKELDPSFRRRILISLLREKATREGMRKILKYLTGFDPIIFEPMRVQDTGAYNVPSTLAYNTVGKYGGNSYAYQAFIIVFRPLINGTANYTGYNVTKSGYNVVPSPELPVINAYADLAMIEGFVTDADIYYAVKTTRMNSTKIWVRIVNKEV